MSHHAAHTRLAPARGSLTALLLLAALTLLALLGSAAAPAGSPLAPPSAGAATPTKPVGYYMFRTRDTGTPATSEQNKRCNNHFGLAALTTISRLNARLFAYEANPSTGLITNQTKSLLGPGFICAVPQAIGADPIKAYAYSSLPGPGLVEAAGGCDLSNVAAPGNPLILACRLGVRAKASAGVQGGLITSNSLVNLLDRSETAPTGSVWTAQIVGPAVNPGGDPGPVPPGTQPETPGLDFFTVRTRNEEVLTDAARCDDVHVPNPTSVRRADLVAAQPDPVTGKVPEPGSSPSVGTVTICFQHKVTGGIRAAIVADLDSGERPITVLARGDCKETSTVAGTGLRAQGCALQLYRGDARAGLVTSNGLIQTGAPAKAADSGTWTFALFGV